MKALLKRAWDKLSRKFLMAAIVAILEGVRAAYPNLPLPPAELVEDLVMTLIGTHTFMDALALIKTFAIEWAKARSGNL
jgi:hypothetical protein